MPRTRNYADVIRAKLAADPDLAEAVALEEFHADLAQEIFDARTEAGLTQKQLADLIGTTQSVIARMEDADYTGHSLNMLRRIAKALGRRFRVEFYAAPQPIIGCVAGNFTPNWATIGEWDPKIGEQINRAPHVAVKP